MVSDPAREFSNVKNLAWRLESAATSRSLENRVIRVAKRNVRRNKAVVRKGRVERKRHKMPPSEAKNQVVRLPKKREKGSLRKRLNQRANAGGVFRGGAFQAPCPRNFNFGLALGKRRHVSAISPKRRGVERAGDASNRGRCAGRAGWGAIDCRS